jgi:hypothetical protein
MLTTSIFKKMECINEARYHLVGPYLQNKTVHSSENLSDIHDKMMEIEKKRKHYKEPGAQDYQVIDKKTNKYVSGSEYKKHLKNKKMQNEEGDATAAVNTLSTIGGTTDGVANVNSYIHKTKFIKKMLKRNKKAKTLKEYVELFTEENNFADWVGQHVSDVKKHIGNYVVTHKGGRISSALHKNVGSANEHAKEIGGEVHKWEGNSYKKI